MAFESLGGTIMIRKLKKASSNYCRTGYHFCGRISGMNVNLRHLQKKLLLI
jgi:hypothetical protein